MTNENRYERKNPKNQKGILIEVVNNAIALAGLRVIEQYVYRDYVHDLNNPNGTLGNSLEGRLSGAYARKFTVCPNKEIAVLDMDGLKRMMEYMTNLGKQFSRKEISYFCGSEYTLECMGFIKREYDGRTKYLFPNLQIFQKIGETT